MEQGRPKVMDRKASTPQRRMATSPRFQRRRECLASAACRLRVKGLWLVPRGKGHEPGLMDGRADCHCGPGSRQCLQARQPGRGASRTIDGGLGVVNLVGTPACGWRGSGGTRRCLLLRGSPWCRSSGRCLACGGAGFGELGRRDDGGGNFCLFLNHRGDSRCSSFPVPDCAGYLRVPTLWRDYLHWLLAGRAMYLVR